MAHCTNAPAAVNLESKSTLSWAGINSILPPELLALAFSFTVTHAVDAISFKSPGGPDEAEVQRRFGRHPLWNASLVCRAWHAIIKDTPSFWAFVAVGFTSPAGPSASRSDPPPATATSRSPHRDERLTGIEILLERSGRLPLTIVLCPENIQDLLNVSQAIHKHSDRLEILGLAASYRLEPPRPGRRVVPSGITLDQALGLLAGPLPKLKLLSISSCLEPLINGIAGHRMSLHCAVDAPELETMLCHTHLITPSSPTRLSSLSLIEVNLEQRGLHSVKLPHLVNLRIKNCRVLTILSTLIIPSVRRLAVDNWLIDNAPAHLPHYNSLQELQWSDHGDDPVFVMLCRLCPNLKRYLNYVEEDSIEKDVEQAYKPHARAQSPTILTVFDVDVRRGVDTYRHWPILEEVSLGRASCDHVAMLIRAVPSIKRVRVLRDPVLSGSSNDQEGERDKLAVLREKVEMAIRAEPWRE
ncbi:hypothetical protein FRC00_013979 [Tulasnella sp. 408]|nr:hypothetical protein FRC00_013979 [Tulasnella sp. 408]